MRFIAIIGIIIKYIIVDNIFFVIYNFLPDFSKFVILYTFLILSLLNKICFCLNISYYSFLFNKLKVL